jgi:hypothetical protein
MKVVGFGCGPWRWYRGVGEIHINKGRVGEERGGKETDECPLTVGMSCPQSVGVHMSYRKEEMIGIQG